MRSSPLRSPVIGSCRKGKSRSHLRGAPLHLWRLVAEMTATCPRSRSPSVVLRVHFGLDSVTRAWPPITLTTWLARALLRSSPFSRRPAGLPDWRGVQAEVRSPQRTELPGGVTVATPIRALWNMWRSSARRMHLQVSADRPLNAALGKRASPRHHEDPAHRSRPQERRPPGHVPVARLRHAAAASFAGTHFGHSWRRYGDLMASTPAPPAVGPTPASR